MNTESKGELEETKNDIQNLFELQPDHTSFDALRETLVAHVAYLLEKNPEKLWQALYRIDVAESKVKAAFMDQTPIAAAIADLIIDRQMQKVKTRRQYRQENPDQNS